MNEVTLRRFMSHVEFRDDCWLWTSVIARNGYGRVSINGRLRMAHRVAYEHFVGAIPTGMTLDHVAARGCKSKACVNPLHLEAVSLRENILRSDSAAAKNARQTHCSNGHPFDETNTVIYGGSRRCRACQRANARKTYWKKRGKMTPLAVAVIAAALLLAPGAQAKGALHHPQHTKGSTATVCPAVPTPGWSIATCSMPPGWHAPRWWLPSAECLHGREGAFPDNTGNSYFGGFQFLESTWEKAGGAHFAAFDHPGGWHPADGAHRLPWSSSRNGKLWPFDASTREQVYRVWLVWLRDGQSFHEWGTARACGLR